VLAALAVLVLLGAAAVHTYQLRLAEANVRALQAVTAAQQAQRDRAVHPPVHARARMSAEQALLRALVGLAVSAEQRAAIARLDPQVVLLVDDIIGSGWSIALAGRALRLAGAAEVLPFALALDG